MSVLRERRRIPSSAAPGEVPEKLRVFSGNSNPELTREIVEILGLGLGQAEISRFANGEIKVIINESVRGNDVFIVQPICNPVNDSLMELLILVDAMRRASASRITAVIPHYGYARQDRKTRGREPITAKLVANLVATAGAGRVLAVDLHAGQIQGFFDIPVDHLSAVPILASYFIEKQMEDVVVVSPDIGGVGRARDLAHLMGADIAVIDKRRPEPGMAEVMNVIGEVDGKTAIIVDDIIDTAGTVVLGAEALLNKGAKAVFACCTHPVFSGNAIERLESSGIAEVVTTNTIPVRERGRAGKIKVLSIAPLLAEAIARIHKDLSVSELFRDL